MTSEISIPVRILAVVVLYQLQPEDSRAFVTLKQAAEQLRAKGGNIKILLYDNAPPEVSPNSFPAYVMYEGAKDNRGLAGAYNRALELAVNEGYEWLLTLDQDTSLPEDFLTAMAERIERISDDSAVAAIVPQVWGKGKRLSPNRFVAGAWPLHYPAGYVGIPQEPTFAFNSGSMLRVEALQTIGGYDARFWLDYCDAFLYRRLQKRDYKVFVAGDIPLQHEFSMQDFKNRVSLARYTNIVEAGSAFWDLEMNDLAGADHTARLAFRILKHLWRRDDPAFLRVTMQMLRKRLFMSKNNRLKEWGSNLHVQGRVSTTGRPGSIVNERERNNGEL